MARGWGRSEEDLGAEKEQAREDRRTGGGRRTDAQKEALARGLRLSLARIEDQLRKVPSDTRRRALETAQAELRERLERLESEGAG
jgi:hypothetical protein